MKFSRSEQHFSSSSVLKVPTADQFYSAMAHLSLQLLDEKIIDADNLIRVSDDVRRKETEKAKVVFIFYRISTTSVHFRHHFSLNFDRNFRSISLHFNNYRQLRLIPSRTRRNAQLFERIVMR